MTQAQYPIIRVFKILHIIGLILFITGVISLFMTDIGQNVTGMVAISSLIGLGLVLVSPFPIALVFQWACKNK
jgi:drug/metabolite transporter (DMT)-like permease